MSRSHPRAPSPTKDEARIRATGVELGGALIVGTRARVRVKVSESDGVGEDEAEDAAEGAGAA